MNTFTRQPNIQQKALQKALESPRIGKHGKRKTTLALEEVRRENAQKLLSEVDKMIDIQLEIAKSKTVSPAIRLKASEMVVTRVLGKPIEQKDTSEKELPVPIYGSLSIK
ncbi:MAG: hypothetical protein NTX85_03040 [Candidatus Nomurabacteria bacterium]|nr:hypothetical protein [Candidatus Nomurabacteria bacterium]